MVVHMEQNVKYLDGKGNERRVPIGGIEVELIGNESGGAVFHDYLSVKNKETGKIIWVASATYNSLKEKEARDKRAENRGVKKANTSRLRTELTAVRSELAKQKAAFKGAAASASKKKSSLDILALLKKETVTSEELHGELRPFQNLPLGVDLNQRSICFGNGGSKYSLLSYTNGKETNNEVMVSGKSTLVRPVQGMEVEIGGATNAFISFDNTHIPSSYDEATTTPSCISVTNNQAVSGPIKKTAKVNTWLLLIKGWICDQSHDFMENLNYGMPGLLELCLVWTDLFPGFETEITEWFTTIILPKILANKKNELTDDNKEMIEIAKQLISREFNDTKKNILLLFKLYKNGGTGSMHQTKIKKILYEELQEADIYLALPKLDNRGKLVDYIVVDNMSLRDTMETDIVESSLSNTALKIARVSAPVITPSVRLNIEQQEPFVSAIDAEKNLGGVIVTGKDVNVVRTLPGEADSATLTKRIFDVREENRSEDTEINSRRDNYSALKPGSSVKTTFMCHDSSGIKEAFSCTVEAVINNDLIDNMGKIKDVAISSLKNKDSMGFHAKSLHGEIGELEKYKEIAQTIQSFQEKNVGNTKQFIKDITQLSTTGGKDEVKRTIDTLKQEAENFINSGIIDLICKNFLNKTSPDAQDINTRELFDIKTRFKLTTDNIKLIKILCNEKNIKYIPIYPVTESSGQYRNEALNENWDIPASRSNSPWVIKGVSGELYLLSGLQAHYNYLKEVKEEAGESVIDYKTIQDLHTLVNTELESFVKTYGVDGINDFINKILNTKTTDRFPYSPHGLHGGITHLLADDQVKLLKKTNKNKTMLVSMASVMGSNGFKTNARDRMLKFGDGEIGPRGKSNSTIIADMKLGKHSKITYNDVAQNLFALSPAIDDDQQVSESDISLSDTSEDDEIPSADLSSTKKIGDLINKIIREIANSTIECINSLFKTNQDEQTQQEKIIVITNIVYEVIKSELLPDIVGSIQNLFYPGNEIEFDIFSKSITASIEKVKMGKYMNMNYSRLLNKVYMQKDFLDQFRNEKVQKIFASCLDTRGKFTELSSTIIEEDKGGLEVVLRGGQLNIISEGLGKFFFSDASHWIGQPSEQQTLHLAQNSILERRGVKNATHLTKNHSVVLHATDLATQDSNINPTTTVETLYADGMGFKGSYNKKYNESSLKNTRLAYAVILTKHWQEKKPDWQKIERRITKIQKLLKISLNFPKFKTDIETALLRSGGDKITRDQFMLNAADFESNLILYILELAIILEAQQKNQMAIVLTREKQTQRLAKLCADGNQAFNQLIDQLTNNLTSEGRLAPSFLQTFDQPFQLITAILGANCSCIRGVGRLVPAHGKARISSDSLTGNRAVVVTERSQLVIPDKIETMMSDVFHPREKDGRELSQSDIFVITIERVRLNILYIWLIWNKIDKRNWSDIDVNDTFMKFWQSVIKESDQTSQQYNIIDMAKICHRIINSKGFGKYFDGLKRMILSLKVRSNTGNAAIEFITLAIRETDFGKFINVFIEYLFGEQAMYRGGGSRKYGHQRKKTRRKKKKVKAKTIKRRRKRGRKTRKIK